MAHYHTMNADDPNAQPSDIAADWPEPDVDAPFNSRGTAAASYVWITDAGHAWLKVAAADLRGVGLTVDAFSTYSYRSMGCSLFYLEEDADAAVFIAAYHAAYGRTPDTSKAIDSSGPSYVRRLPSISLDRTAHAEAIRETYRRNAFAYMHTSGGW